MPAGAPGIPTRGLRERLSEKWPYDANVKDRISYDYPPTFQPGYVGPRYFAARQRVVLIAQNPGEGRDPVPVAKLTLHVEPSIPNKFATLASSQCPAAPAEVAGRVTSGKEADGPVATDLMGYGIGDDDIKRSPEWRHAFSDWPAKALRAVQSPQRASVREAERASHRTAGVWKSPEHFPHTPREASRAAASAAWNAASCSKGASKTYTAAEPARSCFPARLPWALLT